MKADLFLNYNLKNTCWLTGGKSSILAYDPVAQISTNSITDFKKFAKKHQDKLLIGYFAYDLVYQLLEIKKTAKDDLKLPLIHFYAFNHWHTDYQIDPLQAQYAISAQSNHQSQNFKAKTSPSKYKSAYKKVKKYIKEGDIYQMNLTHRLEAQSDIPARELFLKTLRHNPVNFAAYIEADDFQVLSASPERFIKIEDGKIETCPVKGTRPRGRTEKEDQQLKKELLHSPKEAAELNMITDLLRNDLGKIAKTGSVKVEGHRLFSKCPTVWHTYSKITAELATSPLEALISMLPGGSITGCPKKRACEIIDELEETTRGIYTGNIGYIMPGQENLDFNIAIRTIIKKDQNLYLQVGGGIVEDSKPEDEFQETLDKAASFMKILEG